MDTLTHPQQFRGIASYDLHWLHIAHNDTSTTCYGSSSNSPTRGEHKNLCWQPHIILNHKSVVLSLPFRRIYIVRGRDNLCSMPYNDIFADHYGVSSIQTISFYKECAPTTTFAFIIRAKDTDKTAPSPIFAPFRRAIRRARQYFML